MSTKCSIRWQAQTADAPGWHLYTDVIDELCNADNSEQPVYLRLDGVQVELETLAAGGVSVTLALPHATARELGLIKD